MPSRCVNFNYADLTEAELNGLKEYQRGGYNSEVGGFTTIQKYCRDGVLSQRIKDAGISRSQVSNIVNNIDKGISKSVASEKMTLYRGIKESAETFGVMNKADIKVGLRFRDKGYFSTSSNRKVANKFTEKLNYWEDPRLIVLEIEEGQSSFPMSMVEDIKEFEVVIPRNTQYEITKIRGNTVHVKIVD